MIPLFSNIIYQMLLFHDPLCNPPYQMAYAICLNNTNNERILHYLKHGNEIINVNTSSFQIIYKVTSHVPLTNIKTAKNAGLSPFSSPCNGGMHVFVWLVPSVMDEGSLPGPGPLISLPQPSDPGSDDRSCLHLAWA